MALTVEAVYENGVLQPAEPLPLTEHERVRITIQPVNSRAEMRETCPECGSPMWLRRGPRGPFLGCSAYPKCRGIKPMPAELKEMLKDLLPPPPEGP